MADTDNGRVMEHAQRHVVQENIQEAGIATHQPHYMVEMIVCYWVVRQKQEHVIRIHVQVGLINC